MRKALATAIAGCAFGSAAAADLPFPKAPPPPRDPVLSWTGFHVGVNAGVSFGGNSTARTIGAPVFANPGFAGFIPPTQAAIDRSFTNAVGIGDRTGAILGAQAGYSYRFYNSFVVGFETDVQGVVSPASRGLFSDVTPIAGLASVVRSSGIVQKRTDWLGTVRGRLGYTFTPAFLAYATGGLAYGGVKSNTLISSAFVPASIFPISGGSGSYATNRVGYTVGAGGEWMILSNLSLKVEYLYYNLGSTSYNGGLSNVVSPVAGFGLGAGGLIQQDAIRTRVRFDGYLTRVGLNYHFCDAPAPVVALY